MTRSAAETVKWEMKWEREEERSATLPFARRRGTCGAGREQMKGRRGDTMHAQDRGGGLGVEGVVCACVCGVGVAVPRACWR